MVFIFLFSPDTHQSNVGVRLRKNYGITPTYLAPNLWLSTGNLHVAVAFSVLDLCCKRHGNEREEPTTSYRWTGLSLRSNWLKFKTSGRLPIVWEECREYTSRVIKIEKSKDHPTCNWLELETLRFWPIVPKIRLGTQMHGTELNAYNSVLWKLQMSFGAY